ncbi:sensor histidine kinase [Dactylosporangium matsuzakiense]|uniref:histidine kinase n=1 Tax=Dactylosporangium matsuzakiense TaxID=53360 RepID=A0A9W6KMS3_9ACTN|nr:ATP-binding protein [Dactylosporangium matsuzakiense]UWZ42929.1 sensor domain-containing protein [Dactylosporangium matsuzakiense]GLL03937.1 histidine kinase [Dactylosporangium matsuzakiense]
MSHVRAWSALRGSPLRLLRSRWPWTCLLYTLVSSMVVWISLVFLPLLLTFPAWATVLAAMERRLVVLAGARRIPQGPSRRGLWSPLLWREIGFALAQAVPGLMSLLVLVLAFSAAFTAAATPLLAAAGRPVRITDTLVVTGWLGAAAVTLAGLAALVGLAYGWVLLACAQAALATTLLSPRLEELQTQVVNLARARIAELDRFERERQRIERDLHDGVQRHLGVVSLRLGLLELDLRDALPAGAELESALAGLDAARTEAELALDALRDTVYGLRPRTLVDDGLGAALHELGARLPIAVTVDTGGVARLPAAVESSLYFVASEAVTNALKHAAATRLALRVATAGERLTMTVTDNGRGGAEDGRGTGILGMRERAALLGGELTVDSPAGGPTTIRIEVPVGP